MADYEKDPDVSMPPKGRTPFVRVSPEQWAAAEELAEKIINSKITWYKYTNSRGTWVYRSNLEVSDYDDWTILARKITEGKDV